MVRFLHIFAFLIAAAVIAVAVVELDQRADEDSGALQPTILPSPSSGPPEETGAPEETFTPPPIETDEPEPSETDEPESTPDRSVSPPRTPTPEPEGTAGPVVGGSGATPHTGASSVPAGVLIAIVSLLGRALVTRGRRSY